MIYTWGAKLPDWGSSAYNSFYDLLTRSIEALSKPALLRKPFGIDGGLPTPEIPCMSSTTLKLKPYSLQPEP